MYSDKFFYNDATGKICDTNTPSSHNGYFLFIDHEESDLTSSWVEVLECTEEGEVITEAVVHDLIRENEDGSLIFSQTKPVHI